MKFTCKAKWYVTLWLNVLSNCPINDISNSDIHHIFILFYSHVVCLPPVQEILKQVTPILLQVNMESYLGKNV